MQIKKTRYYAQAQMDQGQLRCYACEQDVIRIAYAYGMDGFYTPRLAKPVFDQSFEAYEKNENLIFENGSFIVQASAEGRITAGKGDSDLISCMVETYEEKDEDLYGWEGGTAQYKLRNQDVWEGVWDDFPQIDVLNLAPQKKIRTREAVLRFSKTPDEGIFGLGQHEKGIFNYNGEDIYMYHTLMKTPMPFFLSSRGYGVLIDCGCLMKFEASGEDIILRLDAIEQLDMYLITGDTLAGIVRTLRKLTGKAVMLPRWMYGYIFSIERFHDQKELTETSDRFRETGFPCDAFIQDWRTWVGGLWGNKILDRKRYPDLKGAVDHLHEKDIRFLIAVWPNAFVGSEDQRDWDKRQFLMGDFLTYDAFCEDAQREFFAQCDREFLETGVDGWWADASEPFQMFEPSMEYKLDEKTRAEVIGGYHKKFCGPEKANLYTLYHCKGLYENTLKVVPDKRPVLLTRSVYPSEQQYGTVHWSGDISASWKYYKDQIPELLNLIICAFPYVTEDIGGFAVRRKDPPVWDWDGDFQEGINDPGYRELYVRWMQCGAFIPVFRSHGTDTPRFPWAFSDTEDMPVQQALMATIRLRYKLFPYTYSWAAKVYFEDESLMRPLFFDYSGDPRVQEMFEEFSYGRDILVCPVLEPMYYEPGGRKIDREKVWKCYLPEGYSFYDYYTGMYYEGGREITADAPIGSIPLFVREGAIIPMADADAASSEDVSDEHMEIRIYAGRDGHFDLYQDEGDGMGYTRGAYKSIPFAWNDAERMLTIADAVHPEMYHQQYSFHVILHTAEGAAEKQVTYTNRKMTVQL